MNHYRHSKSSLFLMELMIDILFFLLLATCCLQFFVKSHQLQEKNNTLNHAVSCCSNTAEALRSLSGNLNALCQDDYSNCYEKDTPQSNAVTLYFNQSYKSCNKKTARYFITIIPSSNGVLSNFQLNFYSSDKPETSIYQLTVAVNSSHSQKGGGGL